jgi:PAS domain S-box-containing protein
MDARFFEISIDLLCFLDFNGHFKRLNPAWERTLGFTREELMSRPFIEFVHPDDRKRTLAQNAAVRDGGQALGFENRYLCKDGSFRWFRWNAAPDADEGVIYSVARDITEEKRAAEERREGKEGLEPGRSECYQLARSCRCALTAERFATTVTTGTRRGDTAEDPTLFSHRSVRPATRSRLTT